MNLLDRLARAFIGRDLRVQVSQGLEQRLHAYVDRCNRADPTEEPLDPDDDLTIAAVLLQCADRGLELDEHAAGVHGYPWGEIEPLEQVRETQRRRALGEIR